MPNSIIVHKLNPFRSAMQQNTDAINLDNTLFWGNQKLQLRCDQFDVKCIEITQGFSKDTHRKYGIIYIESEFTLILLL